MKTIYFLLLLSGLFLQSCQAQNVLQKSAVNKSAKSANTYANAEVLTLSNQLQSKVAEVLPASVLIITHEYLAGHKGMMASGVSVTEDGVILTAGHMVIPGGNYEIVFPDGEKVAAKGYGKIGNLDVGILKITEKGKYPFAEMGSTLNLKMGEPCFSLAYPGSFPSKMVVRFGQVLKLNATRFGSMQTTCLMEPGDSGGPVFDMDGKVIGIRSYIGMPLDENYEIPVDFYKKYWSALQNQVDYQQLPEEDSIVPASMKKANEILWPELMASVQKQGNNLNRYAVRIESEIAGSVQTIVGALINLDGLTDKKNFLNYTYVVSKNSEVGITPKVFVNGTPVISRVAFTDKMKDLVLLQLDRRMSDALTVKVMDLDSVDKKSLGKLLVSPLPSQSALISVTGSPSFSLPGVYNVGFLGVKLEKKDGKNIITSLQPNSAAQQSGLRLGDEIISINDIRIDTPENLINELKSKQPRELVTIVSVREGKRETRRIALQSRPYKGIDHISEEFTDGRSEIRDGFDHIFIHDAKLKPAECGGPVFDSNHKFMGINMARYSRTSSLAMPASEVVAFLKAALGDTRIK